MYFVVVLVLWKFDDMNEGNKSLTFEYSVANFLYFSSMFDGSIVFYSEFYPITRFLLIILLSVGENVQ